MNNTTMKINLVYLDQCCSDYFQGCSPERGIFLAVPIVAEMTKEELVSGILDDWNGSDWGDDRFDNVTSEDIRAACDDLITKEKVTFQYVPTSEEYENDESLESVYLYILVEAPEKE